MHQMHMNHPNVEKNFPLSEWKAVSEQLSEFQGILGATLGSVLTTEAMRKPVLWVQFSELLPELVGGSKR